MINTALATTINNTQDVTILKPAFNELARFLLNNNIKFNETSELLKSAFIDSARQMHEKELNASAISLKTGIDRRQIPNKTSLAGSKATKPRTKPDPIILVLAELRRYQNKHKTDLIQKKGPGQSLYSFCERNKGRLTSPTIVKELTALGCIEVVDKKTMKILSTHIRIQQSDTRKFDYASNQFFKVINTIRKNIESPENSVLEWSVESTKMSIESKKQLSEDIKKVRDYLRSQILDAVDTYESDVPEGTYEPYSLNFYVNSQGT